MTTQALKDISFEVQQGEALWIIGRTGAGDTAIAALDLAAGVDLPHAVRLTNLADGIAVGKLGAAVGTPEELIALDSKWA